MHVCLRDDDVGDLVAYAYYGMYVCGVVYSS